MSRPLTILPPSQRCTYRAFREVVRVLPAFGPGGVGIVSQGWQQTHSTELRTTLRGGRPAVLQFNVGERYLLVQARVPRLWVVADA